MEHEVLKYAELKGKNIRINVYLLKDKEEGKSFYVHTKRLTDFKKRIITQTKTIYSVESFFFLQSVFELFTSSTEIQNKILLREINNIEKAQVNSNITK